MSLGSVLLMRATLLLVLGQTGPASAQLTSIAAAVPESPASALAVCSWAASVPAEEHDDHGAGRITSAGERCSSLMQKGSLTTVRQPAPLEVQPNAHPTVEQPVAATAQGMMPEAAALVATTAEELPASASPPAVAASVGLQQPTPSPPLVTSLGLHKLLARTRKRAEALLVARADTGKAVSSLNVMMIGVLIIVVFVVIMGAFPLAMRSMFPNRLRTSGASEPLNQQRQQRAGTQRRPASGPCAPSYSRSPGGATPPPPDAAAVQAKRYSDALTPAAAQDFPALHLCPELVVPEGQECTLLVPRLPTGSAAASQVSQISVDDLRGVAVFHAYIGRQGRCLTLASAGGDSMFAYCCEEESNRGLTIHHASDAQFGTLKADGGRGSGYTIATRRGWRVHVRGDMRLGNLNATDEQGQLLAIAEPFGQGGGRRSVRIGPQVDAGLIAVVMLGVDFLEQQASLF